MHALLARSYRPATHISPGIVRAFSTTSPKLNTIPFHIISTGTGVTSTTTSPSTPHTIPADAYPAFGGSASAPTPLHYSLASLSTCTQVTGSLVAKDLGLALGEWKVSVDAELDPAVLVQAQEGNANWKSIALRVEVETEKGGEVFERFRDETERRCPISQLFVRSGVQWRNEWVRRELKA